MSLSISSLNSGSNGNCYYVGNQEEAILVDAGISCREIEKRIARLGLSLKIIKAIFISHEHSDHIRGLSILSKKYQIPVYITAETLNNGRIALERHLVNNFAANETVQIGNIAVTAFAKMHDAVDPFSFIAACNNVTIGIFTDLGIPCNNLTKHFSICHAAFLESNYDEAMLENGNYPYHLKKRIRGGQGHLSNHQALEVFTRYRPAFMSHLILSHLSKNNNTPQLVEEAFTQQANGVKIIVASRDHETEVYHINPLPTVTRPAKIFKKSAQLSFSFS